MSGAASAWTLTDEQERAVARREGSLLLAAGAGSGKTAVLVERFARAVIEDGVAPAKILAITFTERAAGELRERIRARLLELGQREAARQAEAAFVSTFHGFCARMLRVHPLQAGIEPAFSILEEGFAGRLQSLAFAQALSTLLADTLKGTSEHEQAVDLVAAYGADPLQTIVLGAYAQLRSQGQLNPRLPAVPVDPEAPTQQPDALVACALLDDLLACFGDVYAKRKQVRGALDFDDLELLARDLLRDNVGVRADWSQRFDLLMVDEFQDSNQRQLQILAALDRDNLFTVGDELQSIYSFRHADVALFRERGERLAGQEASLALTRSFRSRPPILVAVQRIFAERMGRRFTPLFPTRQDDPTEAPRVELLLTDKRGWERRSRDSSLAGLPDATPWRQAEATLLAGRVAELVADQGVRPGEVVVLLRALGDLAVYEGALREAGLPTTAAAGGFWSHQQVGDLLAWLGALANPLDERALYSTLACPLVGLSSDGLALIASFARSTGLSVWQAIDERALDLGQLLDGNGSRSDEIEHSLGGRDSERLARFRDVFAAQRAELSLHPIADLLANVVAVTGYEQWVLAQDWGERRLSCVHKLLRLARSFEAQEGRDLRGFLDYVAHVESTRGGREPESGSGEDIDAVCLMSVHAAKGLEFPVVCVADLGRELNLRQPDLLVDAADGRIGLRLHDLQHTEATAALAYKQLAQERRVAQVEEEDRILYVACTRAQERLLLSGVASFERWPAPREGVAPIAWMAPALVPALPALIDVESRPDGALTLGLGDGLVVRCLLNVPRVVEGEHMPPRSARRVPSMRPSVTHAQPRQDVAAAPAAPLRDPDGTVSYTSLAELERCGYRFYLERVLRMPERPVVAARAPAGELDARLRGTIVHSLLEAVDFARPVSPGEDDVAQLARGLGVTLTNEQRGEIVVLIAAALAAEPAARLALLRSPRREHPFAFALERADGERPSEPLVTGFIDLIAEQPDGSTLIVDYKSDRLGGGEDLEQIVHEQYGAQRLIYALAAVEAGAREVEVAHWFLERPDLWVSARFSGAERERLRERLIARLAAIRDRGFVVTDDPHRELCLTCPGRDGLCSWGKTHTMRTRSNHIGKAQSKG
ncbi:MAG TPA: UvrD-helicase domain-containing protein [Solirubrobacteraceae bacterium]|nr:UvrD-helicase domain-containing protein [Solirubrobacteraceae bacterium]